MLAADPEIGAGNVLAKLIEHGAPLDGHGITFDTDVDGHPAWQPLTLGALHDRVRARAQWLHRYGISPRDPVAVYVTSAADCLLAFMALTWLGAIPALINGNVPADVAAEYIRRLRGVGVITDIRHRDQLDGHELGAPVIDAAELGSGDPARAPRAYQHDGGDPIAITHSSGTTRTPAAVVHSHDSLFAATRLVHLATPRSEQPERTLCVLPAAHAAGIISHQQAMCNRHELAYLSAQGGQFATSGAVVIDAIERWRPTGVYGFAVTWAELARFDLTTRDLSSVSLWFNTGDCAHEAHVRKLVAVGSHLEMTREGIVRAGGSKFIDGIGSTEMGHSAFEAVHRPGSNRYGRCVGKPHAFAQIALLDLETGTQVPVGHVGHVGLKSPTLALGYWNDSVTTYRYRFRGYYLTGDLMYQDQDGYYYHMDREVDSVDLGGGNWLYTAMTEERILTLCPDVRDCTVVAGPGERENLREQAEGEPSASEPEGAGATLDRGAGFATREGWAGQASALKAPGGEREGTVTDVLLLLAPGADPDADRTEAIRAALGEPAARTLRRVVAVRDEDIVVGPTGKVRKFLMRQRHLAGTAVS
jgi:acyl-coenzyme A synthetase/AMP-(fatty) acid ligase